MVGRAASICAGVTLGPVRSASLSTSSMLETGLISTVSVTSFGTSTRSFRFFSGRMKVLIPARCAASSFSFTPPIGRTRPRRVISPVIATSRRARGLLHDLLDLAGEDELLGLRALIHDRRLDGEDVAAGLAHRDSGDRADL